MGGQKIWLAKAKGSGRPHVLFRDCDEGELVNQHITYCSFLGKHTAYWPYEDLVVLEHLASISMDA